MTDIKIYTSPTCPHCERAKELLNSNQVKFEEVDIEKNMEERIKLLTKYNWMTTPAVFVNDELIGGYDELVNLLNKGELK